MNRILNFAVVAMSAVIMTSSRVDAATPTITGVTAQQRYPWDGKVDISYMVTGDIAEEAKQRAVLTSLKVTAIDTVANTTNTATQLSGDLSLEEGTHAIVWDMNAERLSIKSSNVVFKVACETTNALYCVIDLSDGVGAVSYPVSHVPSAPLHGFNADEFKTTKLVLRRLEAGSFIMGDDQNDESHHVTLTQTFFCGLFEVTQKQYALVTGSNPSSFSGDALPVGKVGYNAIRGSSNGANWPSSSAVDSSSFMGKLRTRTGLDFDLPTDAQWEYACRAGTTAMYSYGDSADGNYMWYKDNSSSMPHPVGSKSANPWGLYDMHGNVFEWCLDWSGTLAYGTDPKGSSSGSFNHRVIRGGSWYYDAIYCTSSNRGGSGGAGSDIGFRLVRSLPNEGSESGDVMCYGESNVVRMDYTVTTPEPVPYSYFDVECPALLSEYGDDYEAAAKATAANGRNKVWECYVAGISPTNEAARFMAKIEMQGDTPIVTWEPDLNTNGIVRTYRVYGSETLENGGNWQYPTNSLHRFFKVTVEMP